MAIGLSYKPNVGGCTPSVTALWPIRLVPGSKVAIDFLDRLNNVTCLQVVQSHDGTFSSFSIWLILLTPNKKADH